MVTTTSAPEGVWTEPDLHLFPQDGHRYEIVDGCLHVAPPPDESHEAVVRGVVTTARTSASCDAGSGGATCRLPSTIS